MCKCDFHLNPWWILDSLLSNALSPIARVPPHVRITHLSVLYNILPWLVSLSVRGSLTLTHRPVLIFREWISLYPPQGCSCLNAETNNSGISWKLRHADCQAHSGNADSVSAILISVPGNSCRPLSIDHNIKCPWELSNLSKHLNGH